MSRAVLFLAAVILCGTAPHLAPAQEAPARQVSRFDTPESLGRALFTALKSRDKAAFLATVADWSFIVENDQERFARWDEAERVDMRRYAESVIADFGDCYDAAIELGEAKGFKWDRMVLVELNVRVKRTGDMVRDMTLMISADRMSNKTYTLKLDDAYCFDGNWRFTDKVEEYLHAD